MRRINRYKFLITAKNQVGIFKPINAENITTKSTDYALINCFGHTSQSISQVFNHLFYLIKINRMFLKKNDIVYIKMGFNKSAFRFLGSGGINSENFMNDFVMISGFDADERKVFYDNLNREKRIYDCLDGQVLCEKELLKKDVYVVKRNDDEGDYYDLYEYTPHGLIRTKSIFKCSTIYDNIIYIFSRKKELNPDSILITGDMVEVLNG